MRLKSWGLNDLYRRARIADFADDMQEHIRSDASLFVYGPTGTGKTWLASASMRHRAEQIAACTDPSVHWGPTAFVAAGELHLELRDTMRADSAASEVQVLEKYSTPALLVLDDLGAEKTSDYVRASVSLLIERRSNHPRRRTIITSNLDLSGIDAQHGQRIASRIAGMCRIIKLTGPDRRLEGGR